MKVLPCSAALPFLLVLVVVPTKAFVAHLHPTRHRLPTLQLHDVASNVEVCSNKDCKRGGGGPRLEKAINTILAEKGIETTNVELCDCQGECGYGPNLVVDGKIINGVKGREAIIKALGIEEE